LAVTQTKSHTPADHRIRPHELPQLAAGVVQGEPPRVELIQLSFRANLQASVIADEAGTQVRLQGEYARPVQARRHLARLQSVGQGRAVVQYRIGDDLREIRRQVDEEPFGTKERIKKAVPGIHPLPVLCQIAKAGIQERIDQASLGRVAHGVEAEAANDLRPHRPAQFGHVAE
jgi:hypothetical protein